MHIKKLNFVCTCITEYCTTTLQYHRLFFTHTPRPVSKRNWGLVVCACKSNKKKHTHTHMHAHTANYA